MNSTKRLLKGDWYCGKCHTHNFAKRTDCFRCHAEKSTDSVEHDPTEHDESEEVAVLQKGYRYDYAKGNQMRRGDWGCPNVDCRAVNFASRTKCFQCRHEKPNQPFEWSCTKCNFSNLDFRTECRKCQTPNPSPSVKRTGDWNCGKCQHYNFARRSQCQECGTDKPSVEAT